MKAEVLPTAEAVALRAAALIATAARSAVRAHGKFVLATSGGTTPWRMLELLAKEDVPWAGVHLFQVDERVAALGDPARNWNRLRSSLLDKIQLPPANLHPMPVEDSDLTAAAARYAATLRDVAGTPPRLDLVHLGLGVDGHTASLVPGDPALGVWDADVTLTGVYQGHRRMTLTYPVLESAHQILWVVTGPDKADALIRLRAGDRSIPAGRIPSDRGVLLADAAASTPASP